MDSELEELTEEIIFLIRQSCYIQLARADAYLEGAVLAAEQVQDTRIKNLETPPEVSGWEFWGNVALTFFLESTVGGKFLAAVTKRIFTPILRQHAIFMALPKSPDGEALKQAQRLARSNVPRGYGAAARRAVLEKDLIRPGLTALGREDVKLYSDTLEAVVRGTPSSQQNLAAAAKAVREAHQRSVTGPPAMLGASDSEGVTILAAAQHHASLTRMGIWIRHARIEKLVRGNVGPADLAPIIDAFGWEDLEIDVDGRKVSCDLSDLRGRYKMMFEALIWTRLYGFDRTRNSPRWTQSAEEFEGVPKPISDYWFKRFSESLDIWNEARHNRSGGFQGKFDDQDSSIKGIYLQQYIWDIDIDLKRGTPIREGQLTQRTAS